MRRKVCLVLSLQPGVIVRHCHECTHDLVSLALALGLKGWEKRLIVSDRAHLGTHLWLNKQNGGNSEDYTIPK